MIDGAAVLGKSRTYFRDEINVNHAFEGVLE